MEIENGKTYLITHSRKGTFGMKVTGQDSTWLTGELIAGKANAILDYNEKYPGDKITIRKLFILNATEQLDDV